MTPKQILDSFSETLMLDERILSAQERALVCTLLQHARAATSEKPETQEAVRAVIASAIGETVAQRAFAILGGSIVERLRGRIGRPGLSRERTLLTRPERRLKPTRSAASARIATGIALSASARRALS